MSAGSAGALATAGASFAVVSGALSGGFSVFFFFFGLDAAGGAAAGWDSPFSLSHSCEACSRASSCSLARRTSWRILACRARIRASVSWPIPVAPEAAAETTPPMGDAKRTYLPLLRVACAETQTVQSVRRRRDP